MSRFVLITTDTEFSSRLRTAVVSMPGGLQEFHADYLPENPEDVLRQLVGEPAEVLLLGPGLPTDGSLKFAAQLNHQNPEISVILIAQQDADLALSAMRAGIRDLMPATADGDTMRVFLERASHGAANWRRTNPASASVMQEHNAGGRVIPVISPKGGVGKTTLATNLAVGLGKATPMSVVIVDLDLQFGDVASGLMIEPEFTITDAVLGPASQDSLVLKTYLSVHPAGMYALCAPRNPTEMEKISGEHVTRLLQQLQKEFQYVVVDTAPGLGEHVLATLEMATDAVWVCGMDIPGVRGLRTGLQILSELHLLPQGRHVVLNMADKRAGLTLQDVEATIGVPVDVVIPRSKTLPYSTNRGVPVLQDNSRDAAAKGLRQLVERFKPNWESRPHKRLHKRAVVQ